jgi:spore cortex formation protein SpoVR/YcgB (stage V sporulation)
MTEWYDLSRKISELRQSLKDKPVEHTLDLMLSLISQIVSRQEQDRLESGQHPIHRALDETRMTLLNSRIETQEANAQWDRRRIDKQMEAIHAKLDAILAKLPEPPQGFDE